MTMERYLDERDSRLESVAAMADRDRALRAWLWGKTSEERLLAFDRWVRVELEARLDWKWAGAAKPKRIEQCRIQLDTLLKALFDRGWNLDGKRLATLVQDALDEVAAAQRAGRVKDFWAFYKAVVTRYVGANAEEIQQEAMAAGAHVSQVFDQLLRKAAPTIPELVKQRSQERLTDRLARQRRLAGRKAATAAQRELF